MVAAYGVATFAAMLLFGFEAWSRSGEFLGLFFRLIGRFGIVGVGAAQDGRRPVSLHWPGGRLADLAPTLLDLMGLPQPPEMTGRSLIA